MKTIKTLRMTFTAFLSATIMGSILFSGAIDAKAAVPCPVPVIASENGSTADTSRTFAKLALSVLPEDCVDVNKGSAEYLVMLSKKKIQLKAEVSKKSSFIVMDEGAQILPADTKLPSSDKKYFSSYKDLNGNDIWFERSDLAKITNKGALTLRGQGVIRVLCIDYGNKRQGEIKIFISAEPDSVKANKDSGKMSVLQPGESIWLSSLLEYSEGKTRVASYQGRARLTGCNKVYLHGFADLNTSGQSDQFFSIVRKEIADIPCWDKTAHCISTRVCHDYLIKALKEGGKKTLKIKDSAAGEVSLDLSTEELEGAGQLTLYRKDPVTGTKLGLVNDDSIYAFFSHSPKGLPSVSENGTAPGTINVLMNLYENKAGKPSVSSGRTLEPVLFDPNKEVWVYGLSYDNLKPLTQYRLGLSVLSPDGSSGSAEKLLSFKTTDLASSHADLSNAFVEYSEEDSGLLRCDRHEGGIDYIVSEGDQNDFSRLSDRPILLAGNSYTLTPVLGDGSCVTRFPGLDLDPPALEGTPLIGFAEASVNEASVKKSRDKLIWKVKDPGIAKVKSKKGSYQATLIAKKPGTTELTVTSKITKKVIMRRTITVGSAAKGSRYYGGAPTDRRSYWQCSATAPDTGDLEELTLDHSLLVPLKSYESRWTVFEAPATKDYSFRCNDTLISNDIHLYKGDKFYIRLAAAEYDTSYYLSAEEDRHEVVYEYVSGDSFFVKAGTGIPVIYCPQDKENYYIFSFENDKGQTFYLSDFRDSPPRFTADGKSESKTGFGLKKEEELWIYLNADAEGITKGKDYLFTVRKVTAKDSLTTDKPVDFSITNPDSEEKEIQWFSFTADTTGVYTFTKTDGSESAGSDWAFASTIMIEETREKNNGTPIEEEEVKNIYECGLEKGSTIYLLLSSPEASEDIPAAGTLEVSVNPIIPVVPDGETVVGEVEPGACAYYSVTADEDGEYILYFRHKEYNLYVQSAGSLSWLPHPYKSVIKIGDYTYVWPDDGDDTILKAGSSWYLKVTNTTEEKVTGYTLTAKHIRTGYLSENWTEGEVIVPRFNHGEVHYAFDVPKKKATGKYRFFFKGPAGFEISLYSGNDVDGSPLSGPKLLTQDDDTLVYETDTPLTEFTRYYFTISSKLGDDAVFGRVEEIESAP